MSEIIVPKIQVFGSDESAQVIFDFAYACRIITQQPYWILRAESGISFVGIPSQIKAIFSSKGKDKVLIPIMPFENEPPKMYLCIQNEKELNNV